MTPLIHRLITLPQRFGTVCAQLPYDATALLARVALAGVFWRSGQTKVQGLQIDLVDGVFELGWPHLADNAVALFRDEYRLPLLPPEVAAVAAASAEHLLPLLLLAGLATRLSALGLLGMTLVIQLLVYPGAWPTHGTWAALLLMLVAQGAGRLSLDRLLDGLLNRWRTRLPDTLRARDDAAPDRPARRRAGART